MKNKITYMIGRSSIFLFLFICSCSYLNEKPDKTLALPDGLKELAAVLDNDVTLNKNTPAAGDIASNYYYLTDANFSSRSQITREIYCWDTNADNVQDWQNAYNRIFYANVVLDEVDKARLGNMSEVDRSRIKGAALFFRGWNFFQLAQIYTTPYETNKIEENGIPLRLSADINERTTRSSILQTYEQILEDLTDASLLLPYETIIATRPSKPAAFAALAIVYLTMGDYQRSERYADSCLLLKDELMDFNGFDPASVAPFPIFNKEVIFHSITFNTAGVFSPNRALVDSNLYKTYDWNDLRKALFFRENADGSVSFKGDYAGGTSGSLFSGLAIDEIYLIKAECAARLGKINPALKILNKFLATRFNMDTFVPLDSIDTQGLLDRIIDERKKELVFRGEVSWRDLRRLNLQSRYQQTLVRRVEGENFVLIPNDKRYTFLIPVSVVQMTGIAQNSRY